MLIRPCQSFNIRNSLFDIQKGRVFKRAHIDFPSFIECRSAYSKPAQPAFSSFFCRV